MCTCRMGFTRDFNVVSTSTDYWGVREIALLGDTSGIEPESTVFFTACILYYTVEQVM
jgi:hypothetical protein